MYTLVAFLATASTLAFVRAVEGPSGGRWRRTRRSRSSACTPTPTPRDRAGARGVARLHTPMPGPVAARSVFGSRWRGAARSPRRGEPGPGRRPGVLGTRPQLPLGQRTPARSCRATPPTLGWLRVAQLVLYLGAGVAGVAALVRGTQGLPPPTAWPVAGPVVLLWAGLPAGVVLLALVVRPLLVARYLVGSLPAIVLVAAVGLSRLRRPGRSAVAVLVASSMVILGHLYSGPAGQDWRGPPRTSRPRRARATGCTCRSSWACRPVAAPGRPSTRIASTPRCGRSSPGRT